MTAIKLDQGKAPMCKFATACCYTVEDLLLKMMQER